MQFTKEQLIEHVTRQLDQFHRLIKAQPLGDNTYNQKTIAAMEIALAALTAEPAKCEHINMDCDDGKAVCLSCRKVWEV